MLGLTFNGGPFTCSLTSQTEPTPEQITPCVILKVIYAGVGWAWLVRLLSHSGTAAKFCLPKPYSDTNK